MKTRPEHQQAHIHESHCLIADEAVLFIRPLLVVHMHSSNELTIIVID